MLYEVINRVKHPYSSDNYMFALYPVFLLRQEINFTVTISISIHAYLSNEAGGGNRNNMVESCFTSVASYLCRIVLYNTQIRIISATRIIKLKYSSINYVVSVFFIQPVQTIVNKVPIY